MDCELIKLINFWYDLETGCSVFEFKVQSTVQKIKKILFYCKLQINNNWGINLDCTKVIIYVNLKVVFHNIKLVKSALFTWLQTYPRVNFNY